MADHPELNTVLGLLWTTPIPAHAEPGPVVTVEDGLVILDYDDCPIPDPFDVTDPCPRCGHPNTYTTTVGFPGPPPSCPELGRLCDLDDIPF